MKKLRFAIIAVVLATIFHFVPSFDSAEAGFLRVFMKGGFAIRSFTLGVGGFFADIGRIGALQKENDELKARISDLDSRAASRAGLETENTTLRGLLAFRARSGLDLVPAEIVGSDPDATVRGLIIDRGSEDGIEVGDPVIVGDGTLVGKIERVSPGRSTVLLPNDPRSAIAVMLADHPETDGVAQGEKGLTVIMSFIPQHAPIEAGNAVITTGREGRLPRGLLLGIVESVMAVASEPFVSATIVPTADPAFLTKVAIIRQR
jgi:rod shape-determining protein MreC